MVGIAELKTHHKLNQKALEIHRKWDELDARERLPLVMSLKESARPLSALVDEHWSRKDKFNGHLTSLKNELGGGNKDKCWRDIEDVIYADLPSMGYCLLSLADARR